MTSLLAVALMIGVCSGSFVATRIATGRNWGKVMGPAVLILSFGLIVTFAGSLLHSPFKLISIFIGLVVAGLGGGIFLIPITSFIQIRPRAEQKGKVIGIANFTAFCGIFMSGTIFDLLAMTFTPATSLLVVGLVAMGFGLLFLRLFSDYAEGDL